MQLSPSAPSPSPNSGNGGEWRTPSVESLTELVHGFYAAVRADALLGPVFENALRDRWEPHLARMVDFWSTVALGSKRFRGNVFGKHMALQGVTPAHFAVWVRLWGEQTERLFAPEVARELPADFPSLRLASPAQLKPGTKVRVYGEVDTHRAKPTDIDAVKVDIL